jgi:hypothetical protein
MASERVRRVWAGRVEAEYRSAAITAQLLHQLIVIGVSPDTLAVAHRIVSDELAHAEASLEVLRAAGREGIASLNQATLALPVVPGPLELTALRTCCKVFCCGETVAVPLFRALRAEAREPLAVAALDRILVDEAVHRAFGWDLLDELLERGGEPIRAAAAAQVEGWIDGLSRAYPIGPDGCSDADKAWGLIPSADYGRIRAQCVQDTIRPWFARRGLLRSA